MDLQALKTEAFMAEFLENLVAARNNPKHVFEWGALVSLSLKINSKIRAYNFGLKRSDSDLNALIKDVSVSCVDIAVVSCRIICDNHGYNEKGEIIKFII